VVLGRFILFGVVALAGLAPIQPLHAAATVRACTAADITASTGTKKEGADRFTIVLVGDTGFNATLAPVDPAGVAQKEGEVMSFADTISGVANEIDGDLAFVNLETVVTDSNDIRTDGNKSAGAFHFRSHPGGVKALTAAGFNLFSLANNHAMDYGAQGLEETLFHMAVAGGERPIAFAGVGADFDEATRPACLEVDGTRIGLGAIGIVTGDIPQHRAGPKKPGQASYRNRLDFETVVDRLATMEAGYRILSIHYGLEGRVVPDDRQFTDWRAFAAELKGIDLIAGHHPHVAQGVELNGKSVIFYGLGNFMHPGTAEMTRFGMCRDYGLMAKVHLVREGGDFRVAAIEAIPLTNTNMRPERFTPAEATTRIYALNHLSGALDDGKREHGVRFTPQADGTGLYCAPGTADLGGKLGELCRGWQEASAPPVELAEEIDKACEDKPFYGQPGMAKRRTTRPARRAAPSSPFGSFR
jgi:poly-gamma-glutamate capsule biosynthesis protein CapA/YwtB (metallophosphatase superfamily)